MAKKQEVSPLETHIEKIVLGVCVLGFIIALVVWGFSSPRSIEVSNRQVSLKQVDTVIRESADRKKREIEENPATVEPVPDYAEQLKAQLNDPLGRDFAAPDPMAPAPPQPPLLPEPELAAFGTVEPPPVGDGQVATGVKLANLRQAVPAPKAPNVNIVRELPHRPPLLQDVVVAHAAVVYDVGTLLKAWQNQLRMASGIPASFAVVAVEVERQERGLDGTWSEPKRVTTVAVDTNGNLVQAPRFVVPDYTGANADEVRRAVQTLTTDQTLETILQPTWWDIFWPRGEWNTWLRNLPENAVTRAARELGMVVRDTGGTKINIERKPRTPTITPSPTTPKPTPSRPRYEEEYVPEEFYEDYRRESGRRTSTPRRATPTYRPTPAPATPEAVGGPVEALQSPIPPVPALNQQMETGQFVLWFHDVQALKQNHQYRYRCRLVLANPLLTYDGGNQAEDPEDARVGTLETPWSSWSAPAAVPEETRLFLTGQFALQKKAKVTVFTQRLGQTLMASFLVERGDAIGQVASVDVIDLVQGQEERRDIDFQTGAVVLSLRFDKPVVRDQVNRNTVEMLYVDDKGELRRCIMVTDIDPDSPEYREYLRLKQEAEGGLGIDGT